MTCQSNDCTQEATERIQTLSWGMNVCRYHAERWELTFDKWREKDGIAPIYVRTVPEQRRDEGEEYEAHLDEKDEEERQYTAWTEATA